jgi:hypothetical protein
MKLPHYLKNNRHREIIPHSSLRNQKEMGGRGHLK